MTRVTLAALGQHLGVELPDRANEILISGVSQSHLRVLPGDVFVASQGSSSHGIDFAEAAVAAGAVAVVSDRAVSNVGFPQLIMEGPKARIGSICNFVYPPIELRLWAVTGTNGKTSTATYLYRLLRLLGRSAAFSGSTGFLPTALAQSEGLTTPEADVLHRQLRAWQASGVTDAVLEVSAQALTRHRVEGLSFSVSGFTNLSHDHLDEYADMSSYLSAKARLFEADFSQQAVITTSDEFGRELFVRSSIPTAELSLSGEPISSTAYQLEASHQFALRQAGKRILDSELRPGNLMARNLALAVAMLVEGGHKAQQVTEALSKIDLVVPGRMQQVTHSTTSAPAIFLDYAHTPAAITESIAELRRREYPLITVVFSASGDRDHTKRPEMAQAAAAADWVIVTDFHPRSEDPGQIRAELLDALGKVHSHFEEVANPAEAIKKAIVQTDPSGAVLWCGPGHLKYREVAGVKMPFDPEVEIRKALEDLN